MTTKKRKIKIEIDKDLFMNEEKTNKILREVRKEINKDGDTNSCDR